MARCLHISGTVKNAAVLLAGLALAGCDGAGGQTLPDGVSAADVAAFKSAVTNAGCAIDTPAQAVPIREATGLDREQLRSITQYLVLTGDSAPTATGFRLITGACANA